MDDDERFIGYCELHSRTERALFHRQHVERLFALAGEPANLTPNLQWFTMREDVADPLAKLARERLKEAKEA